MMGGSENALVMIIGLFPAYIRRQVTEVMKLEADRMSNLVFAESQALSERVVLKNASRTDQAPAYWVKNYVTFCINRIPMRAQLSAGGTKLKS